MDYKKAYEAAFERAKGIYKEYPSNSTAKVACEQIFPELIESEDERIREALIKGLNFLTTSKRIFTFGDIPIEDIVAYLEKQKEQKPADNVSKEEYVKRFKALCDAYEIKLPNREYDIYHLCSDLSKLFTGSDEQKPAEWSEKEKGILLECISALQNSGHWLLADKLSSLRPQPHWKPSEEQMKVLNEVVGDYRAEDTASCEKTANILESLYNDLESL